MIDGEKRREAQCCVVHTIETYFSSTFFPSSLFCLKSEMHLCQKKESMGGGDTGDDS